MRCVEFTARWNEVLDLRECPEDDAELLAHLESCPACRERYCGFEMVCDMLRARPLPDLLAAELAAADCLGEGRDSLAERVLADLAAPRAAERAMRTASGFRGLAFRGLALRAAAGGVAAATLLAMYLSSGWQANVPPATVAIRSGTSGVGESPVAAVASNDVASISLTAAGNDMPETFSQADLGGQALVHGIDAVAYGLDAMGAVARDTGQELVTVVRRMPDVAIELAGDELAFDGRTDLTAASEPLLNVSQSLRPVANSMSETWHILKSAMPIGEPRRG